jgi:hypothetical protein
MKGFETTKFQSKIFAKNISTLHLLENNKEKIAICKWLINAQDQW